MMMLQRLCMGIMPALNFTERSATHEFSSKELPESATQLNSEFMLQTELPSVFGMAEAPALTYDEAPTAMYENRARLNFTERASTHEVYSKELPESATQLNSEFMLQRKLPRVFETAEAPALTYDEAPEAMYGNHVHVNFTEATHEVSLKELPESATQLNSEFMLQTKLPRVFDPQSDYSMNKGKSVVEIESNALERVEGLHFLDDDPVLPFEFDEEEFRSLLEDTNQAPYKYNEGEYEKFSMDNDLLEVDELLAMMASDEANQNTGTMQGLNNYDFSQPSSQDNGIGRTMELAILIFRTKCRIQTQRCWEA